jgi:hypothetical protein
VLLHHLSRSDIHRYHRVVPRHRGGEPLERLRLCQNRRVLVRQVREVPDRPPRAIRVPRHKRSRNQLGILSLLWRQLLLASLHATISSIRKESSAFSRMIDSLTGIRSISGRSISPNLQDASSRESHPDPDQLAAALSGSHNIGSGRDFDRIAGPQPRLCGSSRRQDHRLLGGCHGRSFWASVFLIASAFLFVSSGIFFSSAYFLFSARRRPRGAGSPAFDLESSLVPDGRVAALLTIARDLAFIRAELVALM